jgi:hypothetical protein
MIVNLIARAMGGCHRDDARIMTAGMVIFALGVLMLIPF